MAMSFSSLTNIVLLGAAMLLLVHASAHNVQQTQTLHVHGAASPNKAEYPTFNAPLEDHTNFIVGSAAGVEGFMGMPGGTGMTLPLPSGTPLLSGSGAFGGLGGAVGFPGGDSVPISRGGMVSP